MEHKRVPDIVIEQYLLGELPEDRRREVELSPGFAERLAELESSNRTILEEYPPEQFAIRINNQYTAETAAPAVSSDADHARPVWPRIRWAVLAFPGAAAVLVAAVLTIQSLTGTPTQGDSGQDEMVRLKGAETQLVIYRSAGATASGSNEAERLEDGATAQAGDELQIAYQSVDHPFGMIVSVDGRGIPTLHSPVTTSASPELVIGREQQLTVAYRLDDAPQFENFYFITSLSDFQVSQAFHLVRSQAATVAEDPNYQFDLGSEFRVIRFVIEKGE